MERLAILKITCPTPQMKMRDLRKVISIRCNKDRQKPTNQESNSSLEIPRHQFPVFNNESERGSKILFLVLESIILKLAVTPYISITDDYHGLFNNTKSHYMKTLALLCFFMFTFIFSFAQLNEDKLFYLKKAEKYRRMKNTGTVLTIGGSVLAVVGIATLLNTTVETTTTSSGTQARTTGNPAAGAVAYVVGAASVGAGIPLWIVGAHAQRKYNRKLDAVSVRMKINVSSTGFTLAYRF